ncbi:uncharacterized protein LOC141724436 isoform X2 [Apium graveolens]|uniref:uncharacterized protein LOC141724436 isoform X2 n=1 Tax=Apium graveolens TaxID=4045 RepID=UPI003D799618
MAGQVYPAKIDAPTSLYSRELDANLENPMTDLEFFKYVYNIDEPTIKKIMVCFKLYPRGHDEHSTSPRGTSLSG